MRTTTYAVIALGLILLAAPAFAADDTTLNFPALSGITADLQAAPDVQAVPTLLTDDQLAAIEGGTHLTTAGIFLTVAAWYQNPAGGNDLGIASLFQDLALGALLNQAHFAAPPAFP
jgi:hypothetical protein